MNHSKGLVSCSVLCLMVLSTLARGQEVDLRRKTKGPAILGKAIELILTAEGWPTKPMIGALPRVGGGTLSQTQDFIKYSETARTWAGRWIIRFLGNKKGQVEIPAITVHVGSSTIKSKPLRLSLVPEPSGGTHCFLEWRPKREFFWVGEAIEIEAHLGIDDAFFARHVLQPFRRPLDVPVKIDARWLSGIPLLPPRGTKSGMASRSLVFNDALARWRESKTKERRDERSFSIYQQTFRFTGLLAGNLRLPFSCAHFLFAEEFQDDFVKERVPKNAREGFAYAPSCQFEIRDLPLEGRPIQFAGAVGQFDISATISHDRAKVRDNVTLSLTIEGTGNLAAIVAPPWPPMPGLRLQGVTRELTGRSVIFRYDILLISPGLSRLAAIEFSYFDPDDLASPYVVKSTRSFEIKVAKGATGEILANRSGGDELLALSAGDDIVPNIDGQHLQSSWLLWLLPWSLGAALLRFLLIRERALADPAWARSRRADREFRTSLSRGQVSLQTAFVSYLAAKLAIPASEVLDRNLSQDLERSSVPFDLAERTVATVDALLASNYGGPDACVSADDLRFLVAELKQAFKKGGRR